MSMTCWSDQKDWNYLWKINKGPVVLTRYNDSLGTRIDQASSSPSSLLGLLKLLQNSETYIPVLEYDSKLAKKGIRVRYNPAYGEVEYSQIYRDLLTNVVDVAEQLMGKKSNQLYINRKADSVPIVVNLLKELEDKLVAMKSTEAIDEAVNKDVRDYRIFCEALVKNKSGLKVA